MRKSYGSPLKPGETPIFRPVDSSQRQLLITDDHTEPHRLSLFRGLLRILKPWLVPATLLVILAGVFVARTAFAKIVINTIGPFGIVADQGRRVTVTGPIAVTTGERLTQRSTGAVAEGVIFVTDTGQTNPAVLRTLI